MERFETPIAEMVKKEPTESPRKKLSKDQEKKIHDDMTQLFEKAAKSIKAK
jgi:hypothetical protein